jgi:hypothetical protein
MATNERLFRNLKDFESEMFPKAVRIREMQSEPEHPSETGGRLAEAAIASLDSVRTEA